MIFDTHAHYDDTAFDPDRDELLSSLPAKGIFRVVNVTASEESLTSSPALAHRYEHVYTSAGLHPTEIYDLDISVLSRVEELCLDDKTVAIGEIGLDYHYPDTDTVKQKEFFEAQLDLARRVKMPVIIHSRDAAKDTMDILKSYHAGDIGGVVHCYSYSPEMAEEYAGMGLYIGVGGVVTYKNGRRLKETVERLPLESIVIETDCPYLSPEPRRGQRNSSLNLSHVVSGIAQLKGMKMQEVEDITLDNAMKLYRMTE